MSDLNKNVLDMHAIFKFLMTALVAAAAGSAVTILFHAQILPSSGQNTDIKYSDFLSITLTALGLMITVLGFFVAAAGVIGWTTIENKLRDHSITYFKEQLGKDGQLKAEIENLIQELTYRGVENFEAQRSHESENPDSSQEVKYDD